MVFVLATNNQKKRDEMERILRPLGISVVTAQQAGISMEGVEETGSTFEENADIKAVAACRLADLPAVADDSGLVVDALDGAPGVYSARYAGENATDADRIAKLLNAMKDVPQEKRSARFISAVCCVFPDGRKVTASASCEGSIAFSPRGEGGFGYDPIFVTESGKTFSQLSAQEKDRISHRGAAMRLLYSRLKPLLAKEEEVIEEENGQ
ncbi:MAG TPA: RdgB/HAM1 family non-canonical purine NTP pyrophosphatase [Candidatus Gallacutalibacter stercoravium]|nr:RdgB/HAM1 family non-canonical purine NTP pyrophosphatase [Candidatus Gallacutalibacter stercoravium]